MSALLIYNFSSLLISVALWFHIRPDNYMKSCRGGYSTASISRAEDTAIEKLVKSPLM